MAEKRLIVCDRCGRDASPRTDATTTPRAYRRITIHAHHDRTVHLCEECDTSLTLWLDDLKLRRESLG